MQSAISLSDLNKSLLARPHITQSAVRGEMQNDSIVVLICQRNLEMTKHSCETLRVQCLRSAAAEGHGACSQGQPLGAPAH